MESHKIPWFQTTNQPQFKMMSCEPLTSIATLAVNAWWLLENSFCGHGEKKMDHYRKPIQSALQENLQHLQMDDSFDVLNFYKIMRLYRNHYKYH
jgi:hypothetical protein